MANRSLSHVIVGVSALLVIGSARSSRPAPTTGPRGPDVRALRPTASRAIGSTARSRSTCATTRAPRQWPPWPRSTGSRCAPTARGAARTTSSRSPTSIPLEKARSSMPSRAIPRVEHVEPMAVYRETFVPNDPLYASKQWHLQRVGAEKAWSYTCGQGVTVAVVDTGIACFDKGPFSRGTDLAGTRCEGGWNFVNDTREAYDDQGHGTHVAGTIAQTTDNGVGAAGLAFCASLMPVKVLNKQGFGSVANVAEGIRFAADDGAQIINLSLGGPIKSAILKDAVDHALSAGRRHRRRRGQQRQERRVARGLPGRGRRQRDRRHRQDRLVLVARARGRDRRARRRRDPADGVQRRARQVRDLRHVQRDEHGLAARRRRRGHDRVAGRDARRRRARGALRERSRSGRGSGHEALRRRHPRRRRRRVARLLATLRRSSAGARSASRGSSGDASSSEEASFTRSRGAFLGACLAGVGLLPVRAARRPPDAHRKAARLRGARDAPARRVGRHRLRRRAAPVAAAGERAARRSRSRQSASPAVACGR